jgi:hypothetical protein
MTDVRNVGRRLREYADKIGMNEYTVQDRSSSVYAAGYASNGGQRH